MLTIEDTIVKHSYRIEHISICWNKRIKTRGRIRADSATTQKMLFPSVEIAQTVSNWCIKVPSFLPSRSTSSTPDAEDTTENKALRLPDFIEQLFFGKDGSQTKITMDDGQT